MCSAHVSHSIFGFNFVHFWLQSTPNTNTCTRTNSDWHGHEATNAFVENNEMQRNKNEKKKTQEKKLKQNPKEIKTHANEMTATNEGEKERRKTCESRAREFVRRETKRWNGQAIITARTRRKRYRKVWIFKRALYFSVHILT